MIRYVDDFVVCFQHRSDAERFLNVLPKRLGKFGLSLEPDKTRLVQFGRFAHRQKKRPETVYFLGITHYCTGNQKGNFMVGRKTEKMRLRRSRKGKVAWEMFNRLKQVMPLLRPRIRINFWEMKSKSVL